MLEFRARKNQKLEVSERQMAVLVGCILGDGYIAKLGKIQLEQGLKQREYLLWKYKELKSICYGNPAKVERIDRRTKKKYASLRFWTRQFFRSLRRQFYRDGKKIFPKETPYFNALSLAVWYMDDGSLAKDKTCILSVDQFDYPERIKIRKFLETKFQIKTGFWKNGKLSIPISQQRRFFQLIKPYIIPSMSYKLP